MPERNFFGQLNTVGRLIESTCNDKWSVLLETAVPAAGSSLWMILTPSPEEIVENYLQPIPTRSTPKGRPRDTGRVRRGRTGRRRWWRPPRFPDLDQMIAQHIPGRDMFAGRKATNAERFFWFGVDVLDRISWYWLLIAAAENFVYEWSSGIIRSDYCSSPFDAELGGYSENQSSAASYQLWGTAGDLVQEHNEGWIIIDGGTAERGKFSGAVTGTVNVTVSGTVKVPDEPIDCRAQLRLTWRSPITGNHLVKASSPLLPGTHPYEITMSADVEQCTRIHLAVRSEPLGQGLNLLNDSNTLRVLTQRVT